jgi:protein-disulfide isomerase-like protein with CxxC motif
MSNQTQQHEQQAGQAFSQDEFSALLNKEFRPKTDQARSAVESAVKTWRSRRWKIPSPSPTIPTAPFRT